MRCRLVVHGDVQGVGFRWSCAREAQRLGVNGWVRNRIDGAVEVVAEGDAAAVQRLVSWAREGPPFATVSHVDLTEETPQGLGAFVIDS